MNPSKKIKHKISRKTRNKISRRTRNKISRRTRKLHKKYKKRRGGGKRTAIYSRNDKPIVLGNQTRKTLSPVTIVKHPVSGLSPHQWKIYQQLHQQQLRQQQLRQQQLRQQQLRQQNNATTSITRRRPAVPRVYRFNDNNDENRKSENL